MKNRLRKVQFKYLDYVFENMCSIKSKHYPDSTFFKKNDKVILELEKSGTLWVLYSVWSNISDTFSFEYEETQQLIKEWMEEQIKSREVTPGCFVARRNGQKEAQLKSREVEPIQNASFIRMEVEEQLKKGEIKPLDAGSNYLTFMEKQIKKEEIEPVVTMPLKLEVVEGRLKSEEVTPSVGGKLYVSDLMEEQLKSAEVTPLQEHFFYKPLMEEQLKSAEVTPRNAIAPPFRWRKLNSEEVLPQSTDLGANIVAEEKLELLEIIPDIKGHSGSYWVESRLKLDEITPQRMNYVIIGGEGEELESEEIKPNATLTSYHLKVVEEQLKKEEVTPRSAIPPQSWTNLKSEEIKPVKFYETELQVLEEQLKQEILKLSKDEKK